MRRQALEEEGLCIVALASVGHSIKSSAAACSNQVRPMNFSPRGLTSHLFFFTTIAKKHPISVLKAIAACWLDSGPLYPFRECSRKDLSVEKFVPHICTRCSSMCVCIYITRQSPVETPPSACQRCTGQTVRPVVAINSRQTRGCQLPGDHADLRVMDVVRGDRHNSR